MKLTNMTILMLSSATLMLIGCERNGVEIAACQDDCTIEITLPDDPASPPQVSVEYLHVVGGSEVEIVVTGGPDGLEQSVLQFQLPHTPFVGPHDRPMETVALQAGSNLFRIRSYEDGYCHDPEGCKYDIVNLANPGRPPLDPWITIHPPN